MTIDEVAARREILPIIHINRGKGTIARAQLGRLLRRGIPLASNYEVEAYPDGTLIWSPVVSDEEYDGGDVWVPAHGFPHYEVSDTGYVRKVGSTKVVLLRPTDGNYMVRLRTADGGGYGALRSIAKLVLQSFGVEEPWGYIPKHHDGNKLNNALENLYWGRCQ